MRLANLPAGFRVYCAFVALAPPSLLPGATIKRKLHRTLRADWSNALYVIKVVLYQDTGSVELDFLPLYLGRTAIFCRSL